ncbi:MAG: tRNA-dependent cyclodipeptide synthase [Pseudobdellovibrionaceae bacterium]
MKASCEYKVKILKNSSRGCTSSCAHIGISLNNAKHVGRKLNELLSWASQTYKQVQLDIYDDIHAYNIQLEKNLDNTEALSRARKMGDQWVEKNYPVLSQFPHIQHYRFSDLSDSLPLEGRIQHLQDLYTENTVFSNLINKDIYSYITRLETRGSKILQEKRNHILNLSRKYILDELALMSLLNETKDFVEIYAGEFLGILTAPQRLGIKGLPEGLKNYHIIEVDFIRRTKESELKDVV